MSADYELLEQAAKAAGVFMKREDWPYSNPFDPTYLETTFDPDDCSITGTVLWYGNDGEIGGTEHLKWNPLTDDGDALRLAVKLRLRVQCEGTTTTVYTPTGNRYCWNEAAIVEGDPYAATRRAIVRAAAMLAAREAL